MPTISELAWQLFKPNLSSAFPSRHGSAPDPCSRPLPPSRSAWLPCSREPPRWGVSICALWSAVISLLVLSSSPRRSSTWESAELSRWCPFTSRPPVFCLEHKPTCWLRDSLLSSDCSSNLLALSSSCSAWGSHHKKQSAYHIGVAESTRTKLDFKCSYGT